MVVDSKSITEAEKVTILAHGDCDGICSAAIALRHYEYAELVFTQPFVLHNNLNDDVVKDADVIVVLDLAIDNRSANKLIECDKYVIIIDHHKQSLKYKSIFEGMMHPYISASQLTSIYYQIPTRLATIGAIGDKTILVSKRERLFKESELIRESLNYDMTDDEFREFLTRSLASGKLPSEIDEVIERSKKSSAHREQLLMECEDRLYDYKNFIFIDATDIDIGGKAGTVAGKLSVKYKKPIFLLFRNSNGDYILTSRSHFDISDIDLSKFMQQFGGGGHKHAASARVDPDTILDTLLEYFER